MRFYTNVQVWGGKILYRGVDNNKKVYTKIDYNPTLFLPSKTPTNFKTIYGEYVGPIKPGNIRDCREFVKKYEGVDGFTIYGNQRYEYTFISEQHPHDVVWDPENINVTNIDIEVGSENGFPEPISANEPITAITIKNKDKFIVFGCGSFINNRDDVQYIRCSDEIDLIKRFIDEWSGNYPDIVTGWNIKLFDIPYIVNRVNKVLGEDMTKRLSPWNIINEREVNFGPGRQFKTYNLLGISNLDYIDLYQRYAPEGKSQESYKLDAICNVELGERKLSYEEYGNLHTLYRENYQLFIEYNIRDVELIEKLDDKLNLIKLALTLAYDSKTNYDDVFAQVRMWDALIYNHLREKNCVLPPTKKNDKSSAYIGAYVKDPIVGLHKWVASFDLDSLYPHLIMQFNISPDTFIDPEHWPQELKTINGISIDSLLTKQSNTENLKKVNATITPNGHFFNRDHQGFLAEMMETMYNDRVKYKQKSIEAKKQLEKETNKEKRFEIEKEISRYNNLQLAKKVCLNSAYGALGNEYFRFFDIRQATAVTTAGQLSIRWIENKLNGYMNKLLKTEGKDYVLASDTDSIYLSLDELVNKTIIEQKPDAETREIIKFMDKICENKIKPFIDKSYAELAEYTNASSQKMRMKREALSDKGIWTAKKRYILNVYNNEGVEYAKPKMKIMGLEMIKSSTPSACRKKLREVLDVIFEKDENSVIEFIETFRKEFNKENVADIAFPRGVNGLKKFFDNQTLIAKGCPIHVRGSLIYNNLIKKNKLDKKYELIKEGEKIKFIYMKEPNTFQSNIISFHQILPKELDIEQFIDYDTQFNKSFVEPLKIILDCIGWKTEKISTLEDFFG
jgi:DNA polymerase elongation subunit (family B)